MVFINEFNGCQYHELIGSFDLYHCCQLFISVSHLNVC